MAVMINVDMADKSIGAEIGKRFKALRLRRNVTQKAVAEAACLSEGTIKSLEAGMGKLSTMIAVLRELNALDSLENFMPEISVSPMQLAERKGQKRERATGTISKKKQAFEW